MHLAASQVSVWQCPWFLSGRLPGLCLAMLLVVPPVVAEATGAAEPVSGAASPRSMGKQVPALVCVVEIYPQNTQSIFCWSMLANFLTAALNKQLIKQVLGLLRVHFMIGLKIYSATATTAEIIDPFTYRFQGTVSFRSL